MDIKKQDILVSKKGGSLQNFDKDKIKEAVLASAKQVLSIDDEVIHKAIKVSEQVNDDVKSHYDKVIETSNLHLVVQKVLKKEWEVVYDAYASYRNYKKEMAKAFKRIHEDSEGILYAGDNENANKDSTLNSTKQALIGTRTMGEFVDKYELAPEWIQAHNEGWIHIHDKAERFIRSFNCCLFDMSNLLKDGFRMNGAQYLEPKTAQSALAVIGDVTLATSSNQYGGFTIPELDTIVAPYAEQSYQSFIEKITKIFPEGSKEAIEKAAKESVIRELEQGIQGFETKLNTISNSLGQVPFVSVSFGIDTSRWGREVSKAILKVREKGLGNGSTQIFPKLIFLHRKEINGEKGTPNYDLKELAIACSELRMYPDYLSFDEGNLKEIYDRCGKAVSPMGCRAYLSPAYNQYGEEFYTGRNNIGAVSLNLPKMAIEADGNWEKLFGLVDKYTQMVWDIHDDYYQKISKMKGSSNPLMWCEGGSGPGREIGYDDEIGDLYKTSTASLGYIGIWETMKAMHIPEEEINTKGIEVVSHLKDNVEEQKVNGKHNYIAALYSSPAESLCYRFQNMNKNQYGNIPGVTTREYLTNSFHLPVWIEATVPEKLKYEAPFHSLATGGRISYNEFPYATDKRVLQQAINTAMRAGMYYGINIISTTCENCGHHGDFMESCPECGSNDLTEVSRCCGYLSFNKVNGESRYNPGKEQEIKERVKHVKKEV